MPPALPKLVRDDPWLEPFAEKVLARMARLSVALADIEANHGGLEQFSSLHHEAGVHFRPDSGTWTIREWAPAARSVSLIGDFNDWNRESHPLTRSDDGYWDLSLPGDTLAHGQLLKLHVVGADDSRRDRIPATIHYAVQDPATHLFAGKIWSPPEPYQWRHQFEPGTITTPLIYETHVGMAGEEPRVHTYREFADHILPRIVKAGYNAVQIMAIAEHPYYGSFGYHVSSFFAPSSRFGTPDDLKHLVDTAHGHGIAVLMDIVHSHAVKNFDEGINNFDGSGGQYFHAGEHGEHPQWDSKCFDYGRTEVQRFLLSNLRYWLEEFHIDGFRFDGVTSLLYWHRGQVAFDHYDRYFAGGVDEDAVLYLQLANTVLAQCKSGAFSIAEDMSGMPGLCRPLADGGLGFTQRLSMGIPDYWIKLLDDQRDEDWSLDQLWEVFNNRRRGEANIAYAESHDQALVGDKTVSFRLMDKEMYWHMSRGSEHPVIERGIALHKMIRLTTLALGGEGWLNFMGNEFGHPEWVDFPRAENDWSYHHCRRQWSLLDNPDLRYCDLAAFDRAMITLARDRDLLACLPAQLLHVHNADRILIAERGNLLFAFNFSSWQTYEDYPFRAHLPGAFRIVLDSDETRFGGHGRLDHSREFRTPADAPSLTITLPPRTAVVLAPAE